MRTAPHGQTEKLGVKGAYAKRIIRGPLIRKGEYRNTENVECERGEFPSEAAEHRRASGDVRLITGGESDSLYGVVIKKSAAIGTALLHISRKDRRSLEYFPGNF